jgi:hypothetical protein
MIEAGGRGAPVARGHHFVPRALLDRFVAPDSPHLVVGDIEKRKVFRTSPANAAKQRDLYRVDGVDLAPDAFETDVFGRIENAAAPILAELAEIRPPRPGTVRAVELTSRRDLFSFVAAQVVRVPSRLDEVRGFDERVRSLARELVAANALTATANEVFSDGESPGWKTMRLAALAEVLEPLAAILCRRRWALLVSASGIGDRIISDSPVMLTGREPIDSFYGTGFCSPETSVYFPISRRAALLGVDPVDELTSNAIVVFEAEETEVRRSNEALAARAQRFIYGSTEQSIRLLVERVATQRTEREHARGSAPPEAQ